MIMMLQLLIQNQDHVVFRGMQIIQINYLLFINLGAKQLEGIELFPL